MKFGNALVVITPIISACYGLKCEVGVGLLTQELDCQGDWAPIEAKLKSILGDSWGKVSKDVMGSLNNLTNSFNTKVSSLSTSLSNSISGVLQGQESRRRKREEDGEVANSTLAKSLQEDMMTNSSSRSLTTNTTDSGYFCVKRTFGNQLIRTCLSKKNTDVNEMTCASGIPGSAQICTCDTDYCNTGSLLQPTVWSVFLLISFFC